MAIRTHRAGGAGVVLGVALALVLAGGAASAAPTPMHFGDRIQASERVQVFVQLSTPSVAEFNAETMAATGTLAERTAQQAQARLVDAEQQAFREQLATLGAEELGALRVGANGLRLRVSADQIEGLKALPGVRTVARVQLQTISNITSVPWIGAPSVWSTYKAKGEHVRIGIIDTGIDYTHANFGGPGTVAAYQAIDPTKLSPGTFPTAKVKGGYDLAGANYDPTSTDPAKNTPAPDPNPLDVNGHGSHVAGTAAGFGLPGSIGPGVAPNADLYAIKVFGDGTGTVSTDLTAQGIEWALDPNGDGDMSDHMDVINLSLGSPFGEPNTPDAIAADNAARLGIVVVISAGNEADVPYVLGSPAVAPRAIAVAAVTPGGRVYSRVNVTAPASVAGFKNNLEGAGPVLLQDVGPISGTVVSSNPTNGCTTPTAPTLTNAADMKGNIALVKRGVCTFLVKYQAAQAAGAKAIIVYNDGANSTRIDPIVMGGLDSTVTIPGVMISYTDGAKLAAAATSTQASPLAVALDAKPDPTRDDQIASFSARGPGLGGTTFKPDLSAPGVSIVSTGVGTGTGSANFQGTSMSAPHVAGAAALLRELHPKLDPAAIKALLQNATEDANVSADTDLARQGVGTLHVDRAAALSSYAAPAGISFGRLNPDHRIEVTRTATLTDLAGDGRRTFTGKAVPHQGYPGVTVTCPSTVRVDAKHAREFEIRLAFDPAVAPVQNVNEDWYQSETEVDGWCVLSDGRDSLRVGYLASVDSASRMTVHSGPKRSLEFGNDGPALGFAQGFTSIGSGKHHYEPTPGDDAKDGGDADHDGKPQAPKPRRIEELGARSNVYGVPDAKGNLVPVNILELGLALTRPWEHISTIEADLYIDTQKKGSYDVLLLATDGHSLSSTIPVGTYLTAQIDLLTGNGFIDWLANWDYNDRVAVLPFSAANNPSAFAGLVPSSFNYKLVLLNDDGSSDTLTGSADLAREIVPDLNDFTLAAGERANVKPSRAGRTLWLFPGNTLERQVDTERLESADDRD